MKISIKGYIASKESELFYDCADRYAYNTLQNKFAISDGVSKSFFPKIWAETLVNIWVDSKDIDDEVFIADCQTEWLNKVTEIVEKPETKWFTKNAFNRKEPGLATFVGLRFFKRNEGWFWNATALGDSFVFFVPGNFKSFEEDVISISSKPEPIIFDNFPDYLSSIGKNHKGEKKQLELAVDEGTFYLMTDALAEWFFLGKENAINKIKVWDNQKGFEQFVDEERLIKKLANDDLAILIIELISDDKNDLNYVAEDVSKIDELIKEEQQRNEQIKNASEDDNQIEEEGFTNHKLIDNNESTNAENNESSDCQVWIEGKDREKDSERPVKGQGEGFLKKCKNLFFLKKGKEPVKNLKNTQSEGLKITEIKESSEKENEEEIVPENNQISIEKESLATETENQENSKLNENRPQKPTEKITDKF